MAWDSSEYHFLMEDDSVPLPVYFQNVFFVSNQDLVLLIDNLSFTGFYPLCIGSLIKILLVLITFWAALTMVLNFTSLCTCDPAEFKEQGCYWILSHEFGSESTGFSVCAFAR